MKFSRDVVFSELPDQFSQVALDASANKQILHNGETKLHSVLAFNVSVLVWNA